MSMPLVMSASLVASGSRGAVRAGGEVRVEGPGEQLGDGEIDVRNPQLVLVDQAFEHLAEQRRRALRAAHLPCLADLGEATQLARDEVAECEHGGLRHAVHQGAGRLGQRCARVVGGRELLARLVDGVTQRHVERIADDRDEEGRLAAEVVVDRRLRDVRVRGDRVDAGVVALAQETRPRRLDDRAPLAQSARAGRGRGWSRATMGPPYPGRH
jgi:hypothetical protein